LLDVKLWTCPCVNACGVLSRHISHLEEVAHG